METKPHWGWIAAAVVALILVFAFLGDDDEPEPERLTDATSAPADDPITLGNFRIDLIVLESQCFDTAGALVTVEPDMSVGDVPPDDYRATLVYEVRGGENTETFNMEIEGGDYTYSQHVISTADCSDELSAHPVRLLER